MKRFFRLGLYAAPYWFQSLLGVVLLAAVGLFEALRLAILQPIFGPVLNPGARTTSIPLFPKLPGPYQFDLMKIVPSHFHNPWTVVAFALIASTVLKGICDYIGTYLVNYAGYGMITDLRNHLYETIMKSSAGFFSKHPTGTILSTLINDVERVQTAVSAVLGEFLQQAFTFVFTIALVIAYGGRLSWVLLLFVPVVITSARKIGRSVRTRTRTGQDRVAEIQNILHETITGNRIVKAFSTELWEILRFKKAARRLFRANLHSVRIQSISSPLMDVIGSVAIALLLLVGRNEIKAGRMDVGTFVVFIIALFKLYDPVRKFAFFYNSFQQAMGASFSIFNFLDIEDDVREKSFAHALKPFHDRIAFENVTFAYSTDEGECEILHQINLEVRRGEMLALVGPSGAGKSTLVNLIPRFYDVSGGRIVIDDHDVRSLTLDSLRKQIAQVTQETILFNDTVHNNIAYGQPEKPRDQVEQAARHALAHDFILRMPQGYDTVIGEKGFRLSGGEKQRIAIARAILKNAPILILDEATSALDTESESLVQAALSNLMQGRTVVVIAHRLSTVRRATRTVVLESGRITAIGSHEELLKTSPTYQRLYELQFLGGVEGILPETVVPMEAAT
ncbi:ABC transporter ATP-binding protein [Acidicapsa acidisoli]|uniref:ABC transporter ATP-binding protein n=1 Tax=Acidicapsa acidisoli TaxID=1615681 RepID=UPI0021E0CB66|nr:ABC transporter ATP-binding protein [Acidicapsa acidisoli]